MYRLAKQHVRKAANIKPYEDNLVSIEHIHTVKYTNNCRKEKKKNNIRPGAELLNNACMIVGVVQIIKA